MMPRYESTSCSQCGHEFGPGDHGYSHCQDHPGYKRDEMRAELVEMADDKGEIAYTSNTRNLLDNGEAAGLVKAVSGKFRMVEPGHLNNIYRLTRTQ